MRQSGQKGSILITLIIAMTLMGVFGAGLYKLTSSSSFGQLIGNSNDDAYNLARAGIRYGAGIQASNYPTTTFAMPDVNHTFAVGIINGIITSTGIVNPGTFTESRRVLTYDASWAPLSTPYIGMPGLTSPIINNPGAIVPDPTTKTINLGGNVPDSYGSIWYQGSSSIGNCVNGVCNFGTCLYAYFDFTFVTEDFSVDSTTYADGFTFALISALNNTRDRTGGAKPGTSQGELMGYAGPDNMVDMLGLKPPKMALEFDTYPNGNAGICNSGSRNDPTPFADHAALLFWGNRTNAACGGYPGASFDDNVHGAGGTGNDPLNVTRGAAGYYEGAKRTCLSTANTCNWLEDGYPYSARIEIARPTPDTATSGTFNYVINAWIVRPVDAGFSAGQTANFQNVMAPYTDSNPHISRTVTLSFGDHSDLSKIFFGFTEATGGATQQITLSNLRVNFPSGATPCTTAVACTYTLNPTSVAAGSGLSADTVSVTAGVGCGWTAVSNDAWITITGGSSGTGNGTVSYSVDANTGPARIGTVTIGGQTFTVNQSGGCTYSLSPTSVTIGSGASSNTVGVTAGAGCTWTAVSNDAWITITGGSSGTGNGTVSYSVADNTACSRTGTMTIGGQTFTVSQSSAALSITTASLPNATRNSAYSTTVAANGGVAPYSWSVSAGTLPAGLTLNASTGVISGTPTTVNIYNFTLLVTDSCGGSASHAFTLTVACPGYRVWNRVGATYDFRVSGTCRDNRGNTNEITTSSTPQLTPGQVITRYSSAGVCTGALYESITYDQAAAADANGNRNCRVNYDPGGAVTDR